ncbi:TetR/AcrR family transcriptional regulator [Leptolyngbya sp. FACHB-261]|uniref:TetR/AcrR family transcriptional regulator n=1 Tax=Leptolyngbya sp. FACHB-261 TaxID=2692806 RepID=UPI0016852E71|nr:TetR/AcrR family transcriptional regulator [Leptolyngbya sp. FACHB-261]MBD2100024.1 TetR/AcrR family transcriptional regulator [Leptolyngbya sp. FACHB-261]
MRFKPDHSEKTKATIVAVASRRFRRDGFNGVGVDGVASEAGMTSGVIYSQFGSKTKLFAAVLRAGLEELRKSLSEMDGQDALFTYLDTYFSAEHRSDPENGCLLPCLSIDAGRSGPDAQAAFGEVLPQVIDEMERLLIATGADSDRDSVLATLALMTGGIMLARALPDEDAAQEMLNACCKVAKEQICMPKATVRRRKQGKG